MKVSDITMERLTKAGWYEGRKIDIQDIRDLYKKKRIELFETTEKFLIEFGMLEITFPLHDSPFNTQEYHHFNPTLVVSDYSNGEYYKELEEELSEEIGEKIIPLGKIARENLYLLLTPSEKYYGYMGEGCLVKFGNTTEEMLECLCYQRKSEKII